MLDSVSDTREGEIAGVKHYSNAAEKKLKTYIYFLDIYLRVSVPTTTNASLEQAANFTTGDG